MTWRSCPVLRFLDWLLVPGPEFREFFRDAMEFSYRVSER